MTNLKNEKELLNRYGKIVNYSELQEDEIKERLVEGGRRYNLVSLITESELGEFTTYINNKYASITLTNPTNYNPLSLHFEKKHKNYLEVELCVDNFHFVPDNLLRNDILFFFRDKKGFFFVIVKDEYITQFSASEHFIVGMIDIIEAKDLFLQKDNIIKSKMKAFQIEINKLSVKYKDILFITISDSIIIKYSFRIINKNGKFVPDRFDFKRVIELFKEVRKITRKIFTMDIYGIFCYGMNKCEIVKSNPSNVFHTGIFSFEFKKIFEIEKIITKLKKEKQGDLYMTGNLYRTDRQYVVKNWQQCREELSAGEWGISKKDIDITKKIKGISEQDIIVAKIPDESIKYP